MKRIKLTQEKYALVDDEDYAVLNQGKWQASKGNAGFYAVKKIRFTSQDGTKKRQLVRMQRIIMGLNYGDKRVVDHVNHNTLDNRKKNLRVCSHSENMRNSRKQKNNTSGIAGVSFDKKRKRWAASITVNNKSLNLGRYRRKAAAAIARHKAEIKYFGQFRLLRLPLPRIPKSVKKK